MRYIVAWCQDSFGPMRYFSAKSFFNPFSIDTLFVIKLSVLTTGRSVLSDSTKEDWPQFVKRVNHFFDANGITNVLAFLAVRGPTTYTLVRNLVMPAKPGEESYDKLVKVLKDHFNPTPRFSISWSLEEAW